MGYSAKEWTWRVKQMKAIRKMWEETDPHLKHLGEAIDHVIEYLENTHREVKAQEKK